MMGTKSLTLIAFLLAIPTFGVSLLVWFWAKFKYDKSVASRALVNAILNSYKNDGKEEVLFAVNNTSLSMVFDMLGGQIISGGMGASSVSGILPHPKDDVILNVVMTQASRNRLIVKATTT